MSSRLPAIMISLFGAVTLFGVSFLSLSSGKSEQEVDTSATSPVWLRWGSEASFPGLARMQGGGESGTGSSENLMIQQASLRKDQPLLRKPPLSPYGPGAASQFYKPLEEFVFPTDAELWEHLGFEKGPATERATAKLREAMVGSSRSRRKIARDCRQELNKEEKRVGHLFAAPSPHNLGCYFERVKRLSMQHQEELTQRRDTQTDSLEKAQLSERRATNKHPRRLQKANDWEKLAGVSYSASVSVVTPRDLEQAMQFANAALASKAPCETTQARSGLMRGLEDFLPEQQIYDVLVELYAVQKQCLQPSDDSFEEIHFRMGLLALERGRLEEAGTSFSYALEDLEGRDEYRVLFWRGLLEALRSPRGDGDTTGPVGLNPFWVRLIQKYPLSFHALVADSITGYELHSRFLERPSPWVAVYQGTEWSAHNAAAFLFALSVTRKDARMMEVMGLHTIRYLDPVSLEQGLFLGLAQIEAGFTRGAIKALYTATSRYGTSELSLSVLDKLYPRLYVEELKKHGEKIDVALALSLMRQESSFNPQAASAAEAKGLMQVLPGTARMMLKRKNFNLYDPVTNIKAGSKYLNHLLERYQNNYVHTLASYNAGPGKVAAWKERYLTNDPLLFADLIPYRETRNYVTGLLRNIHWYRVLLNGDEHHELISSTDTATWTARSLIPDPLQWGIDSIEKPVNLVFETVPDFKSRP